MECSRIQFNDLPDEILMIILKNLNNLEVLYTLIDINERLNKVIHDPIFTSYLTLMGYASNNSVYPLCNSVLDRFCLRVLPQIHHKIKSLYLESLSMERILLAANYPNLYQLGLYNIQETAIHLFNDETLFTHTFKNQILYLIIDINTNRERKVTEDGNTLIFTHIFTIFTNLQYLNFCPSSICYQKLSFNTSSPTVISSNLLELHVYLEEFTDCLYLLDGRFSKLRAFCVKIYRFSSQHLTTTINNKEKLPSLEYFSLDCDTYVYVELIISLLHRMLNLEKLDLSFESWGEKTLVDGNYLKKNIINYMPRLKKFTFNIHSCAYDDQIYLPSNEDIQNLFKNFNDNQIIFYVDYFPEKKYQCHIYSYPYKWQRYNDITNNFPGGIFRCVREVSLFDEHPFEHDFFLRIAQSFPLMKKLTLSNQKRQINKRFRQSKNGNQDLSIIKYPHLIELDIADTHKDYHEQFLLDTKMCLPNIHMCRMDYRLAKKVTRNFTRNTTRSNCVKMSYVCFGNISRAPEHLKDYFPHARIVLL